MANQGIGDLQYQHVFASIGKFIASKNLQNVCVMEFEDGIIISGSVIYAGSAGFRRNQETFVLGIEELKHMVESSKPTADKRGLFGR